MRKKPNILIGLLLLSVGCGSVLPKEKTPASADNLTKLSEKRDTYRKLLPSQQGPSGFIESEFCDSLLFSGLLSSGSSGNSIRLKDARNPDTGEWFRRPLSLPECFSSGKSRSTISRDQLLGTLWYAVRKQDRELVISLWEYGQSRNWVMGRDSIQGGHTLFLPLIPLLARIRYYQSGESWDVPARLLPLPAVADNSKTGFEAHLQVLQIVLDNQINPKDSSLGNTRLQEQADREPGNPLFRWAVGDTEGAVAALLREDIWPSDRLPTKQDVCPAWVLERDSSEWVPCDSGETITHSGGDFLFVADLVLDGFLTLK
jgi:hypothetical protein